MIAGAIMYTVISSLLIYYLYIDKDNDDFNNFAF